MQIKGKKERKKGKIKENKMLLEKKKAFRKVLERVI